ncbi:sigma-54-dependent Fis family transcriptional regulator [Marinococcus halophilus]|uniref:sigma-54-dependent Fis family transcriptional regulator n=1 Tax=Marinococcus halophilus TaxID=1371 RepID=UPI0009A87E69|nr:sigma-54-dependent Fis family transcriptional regulator [Marinococcus halophilus]
MRNEIEESWRRCEKHGLEKSNVELNKQVNSLHFEELKEKNQELLNVAMPVIEDLHGIVHGTGFLTLLTTENGVVLNVMNDSETEWFTDTYELRPGRIWREEVVGTSAISLVVHNTGPCQVVGKEHYWQKLHGMTCSAAPVKNENNDIIGVVNVSGPVEEVHDHTLGMVMSAAKAIERQIQLNHTTFEIKKSNQTLNTLLNVVEDGVLLIDNSKTIIQSNEAAKVILQAKEELLGKSIFELLEHPKLQEATAQSLSLKNEVMKAKTSNRSCVVQVKPTNVANASSPIVITFREVRHIRQLARSIEAPEAYISLDELRGRSESMKRMRKKVEKIADSDATTLIIGETGTGKEIVAQSIHNISARREGPFIVINCAALPRTLLESELFGYEGGTFTGGHKEGKPGKFEIASGGTIFLDEIGEMTLDMQVILLRVLQEQRITRLGGNQSIPVDIRVLSATNKPLKQAVASGEFRKDLYYRLNLLRVELPPLRERNEDIPDILEWFMYKHTSGIEEEKTFSHKAMNFLQHYPWPGNVRELENIVKRSLIMSEEQQITKEELLDIIGEDLEEIEQTEAEEMDYQEKAFWEAFNEAGGNLSKTADILGKGRATVYRWYNKYSSQ